MSRLVEVLKSWEGTPYMAGQAVKEVGVDCVRFVASVVAELQGRDLGRLNLPMDAAFHHPAKARRALQILLETFPHEEVSWLEREPGDVLILSPPGGGPGHAMIVGSAADLWHATQGGVRRSGLSIFMVSRWGIWGVYRPEVPCPKS